MVFSWFIEIKLINTLLEEGIIITLLELIILKL